jgi:hypothetical protein
MELKILGISGSPVRGGNVDTFLAKLESRGQTGDGHRNGVPVRIEGRTAPSATSAGESRSTGIASSTTTRRPCSRGRKPRM